MYDLKNLVSTIKSISEKDYQKLSASMLNVFLYEEDLIVEEVEDLFKLLGENVKMNMKEVSGIAITYQRKEQKLYNYPEYHWDGGNSVYATTFNLIKIDSNDFCGGPNSHVAVVENKDYPGLVMYCHEGLAQIHILK